LTTKRGDSGSAGMLGEKCVIIEAPNLTTKSDQNKSPTWKMTKNDQNSSKSKNIKIDKNQKSSKVTKTRKCKSEKSDKMEIMKSVKKVSKIDTPPQTPKCHLNGQNWHFVKSEPPGPALFEFQGVPRDPILRPKSTPSFLNVKKWHSFAFYHFVICTFWSFCKLVKLMFQLKVTFFTVMPLRVIRPYSKVTAIGEITQGRI